MGKKQKVKKVQVENEIKREKIRKKNEKLISSEAVKLLSQLIGSHGTGGGLSIIINDCHIEIK